MTLNTGRLLLFFALILGAALRVPGWFTAEEKARWRLFEVDEEQHVAIVMKRYNELSNGVDTISHRFRESSYNVRGYGYVTAAVGRVKYAFSKHTPNFGEVLLLGRQLSTLYALLLIVVVFCLGKVGGLSPPAAGVAALLMAACDVNATYSHYMLPASGYIMFSYLALLGGVKLIRGPSIAGLCFLALGAAGAVAFKFDVFPTVWGGVLLILLVGWRFFGGTAAAAREGLGANASAARGGLGTDAAAAREGLGRDAAAAREGLGRDAAAAREGLGRDAAAAREGLGTDAAAAREGLGTDAAAAREGLGRDAAAAREGLGRNDAAAREGLRTNAAHSSSTPRDERRPSGAPPGLGWWVIPLALVGLVACFIALTYGWSWEEIEYSFRTLRKANKDVIHAEDHFRDNLITYPLGVLAGIGLPAFALAAWATVKLTVERWRSRNLFAFKTLALCYGAAFLLTEFALRWYMDTTFIRRVNIFMPAVALLAAYALQRLKAKPWLGVIVVAWSVGLGVVGQSHHWYDTRIEMRDWANVYLPKPASVAISASINIDGMRNWRYYLDEDWDYFITSEAFYRRYTKSMTTPFGIPDCNGGIYHGGPADQCEDFQAMLLGTHEGVVLVKEFRTWDVFPERLLYHHFFGYYETFLGDVKVFHRIAPPKNDRSTS